MLEDTAYALVPLLFWFPCELETRSLERYVEVFIRISLPKNDDPKQADSEVNDPFRCIGTCLWFREAGSATFHLNRSGVRTFKDEIDLQKRCIIQ